MMLDVDTHLLVRALIGLLPVLCFLGALVALDSYKLVQPRDVGIVIALGGIAAGLSYVANLELLAWLQLDFLVYARSIAPLVEEGLKGAVILVLIRSHRAGFLVDAAIFGFAVGTGFALIENLYYLQSLVDAHIVVWLVRGFGTALLHGGLQAIFAVMVLALTDRRGRMDVVAMVLPLMAVATLHAIFNAFVLPPVMQTLVVMLLLPPVLMLVFARSESAVSGWLGQGFDADREMIQLLDSGRFSDSPAGQYLHALREHFDGQAVADLVCYLRLHVELALRAKGILLMRENGIEVEIDDETREKFEEMRYLEKTVGPTAMRAIKPLLHTSRRDLWQLYLLGK